MSDPSPPPPTPGVGARRQKFPTLPLSAFLPSDSGNLTGSPAPPSPSSLHPASIIDAHYNAGSTPGLGSSPVSTKLTGLVVAIPTTDGADKTIAELKAKTAPVIAVTVPVTLQDGISQLPPFLSNAPFPVSVSAKVSKSLVSPSFVEGVRQALDTGTPVELEVIGAVDDTQGYDFLVELITNAQEASKKRATPIIITNILPPLSSIDLPIVKLLSHPGYSAYQSHVGSLSLVPNTYLKFIPPSWETVGEGADGVLSQSQVKEWKRRVKMYLGPAVEAFGDARILFGTSAASSGGKTRIHSSDWYALAAEAVAEVGVEQEGIEAIFAGNALAIYGSASS